MSIFNFFFRRQEEEPDKSAGSAKERLQIVVAHDRAGRNRPDYLPRLQRDLIDVVSRYVPIDPQKVQVKFGSDGGISTLEVDVELPQEAAKARLQ